MISHEGAFNPVLRPMIHVAQFRAHGRAAGVRYLRPEIGGERCWTITITVHRESGFTDTSEIELKQAATLSAGWEHAVKCVDEMVSDDDPIVDYQMDFHVPSRGEKRA